MDADSSTHPKGTNRKRARFSCFRLFAVVIRHLISRPQRTPKSSTNVTAKVLKPAKLPQRLRRPTLRWLRSFLLSKCCRWRRVFPSRSYRTWQVTDEWSLVRKFSLSVSSIGYEKRESGESEVFHRIKSLICRKKRSFESKTPRIMENNFRITTIYAIFVSNIQRVIYMKTIDNTPPDLSGRP